MPLLSVKNLTKSYRSAEGLTEVLRGVSFDMEAGTTMALEGESGSGKSTALHLIAGLDRPSGGSISLDGIELASLTDAQAAETRRSRVGIIFQQFNLIPSLTAGANIAFLSRLGGRYDPAWAEEISERIGLADHLGKYPEALSGGQQQRVAIARTLAARPKLILADEPTGNLDEDTADRVLALMLEAAADAGAALLVVTHSPRLAGRMQRRLVLSHGTVHETDAGASRDLAAR